MAEDARRLAYDAVGLAILPLEGEGRLSPFLLVELGGFRDIEHFGPDELESARARAVELAGGLAPDQLCALAYTGRVDADQDAILIEVHRPGSGDVEVFHQRFRAGRFRRFKLVGEVSPAQQSAPAAEPRLP